LWAPNSPASKSKAEGRCFYPEMTIDPRSDGETKPRPSALSATAAIVPTNCSAVRSYPEEFVAVSSRARTGSPTIHIADKRMHGV
jgi:hypothetical protein